MSSVKWRPFCLGLNVLRCKDYLQVYQWFKSLQFADVVVGKMQFCQSTQFIQFLDFFYHIVAKD